MIQFESIDAFLHMGGYALYVWLSYGLFIGLFIGLYFQSKRFHRATLKDIAQQSKREARIRASRQKEKPESSNES